MDTHGPQRMNRNAFKTNFGNHQGVYPQYPLELTVYKSVAQDLCKCMTKCTLYKACYNLHAGDQGLHPNTDLQLL